MYQILEGTFKAAPCANALIIRMDRCDGRDSLGPCNHVGELQGIMQQHAKFSQEMTERPFPLFDTEPVW